MTGEWQIRCRGCCRRDTVRDHETAAICDACGWVGRYSYWSPDLDALCRVWVCAPAGPEYEPHPPWDYCTKWFRPRRRAAPAADRRAQVARDSAPQGGDGAQGALF